MNSKIPIALLIDDSSPLVQVYWYHIEQIEGKGPFTNDGRLLEKYIPNDFMDRFCNVMEINGMAGKISIVPVPGGEGNIVNGIPGYDTSLITQWLNMARERLSSRFDFSPECLTHNLALDLKTGKYLDDNEMAWSNKQDRSALTPYLINALGILKAAGITATGVTSPWNFAIEVENEYIASIITAQREVYRHELTWYFLHVIVGKPRIKPWLAGKDGNSILVSIPATVDDGFWQTIDCPRTDKEYIDSVADKFITKDGKSGSIIEVLKAGGWPIICTHWQSLFSNGLETGLYALDEVGKRVDNQLKNVVEWKSCMELVKLIVE